MRETSCSVFTFPHILGQTQVDMNKPRVLYIFMNIPSIVLVQICCIHTNIQELFYMDLFRLIIIMMMMIIDSLAHAIFYNHPFDP